jgi:hypothetical protein
MTLPHLIIEAVKCKMCPDFWSVKMWCVAWNREKTVNVYLRSVHLLFSGMGLFGKRETSSKLPCVRKKSMNTDIFSRGRTVGTATGYELDDGGVGVPSPGSSKNFHFSISSRPALGPTQPPIQRVPGANRQRHAADHSTPTNAEVKKLDLYIHPQPRVFMA